VPEKPLAEMVRARAEAVARRQVAAVAQTMRLEDQAVDDSRANEELHRQAVEDLLRRPVRLWDE
jgi:hypothetical protein